MEVECRVWGLPVSGVVGARVSVLGGARWLFDWVTYLYCSVGWCKRYGGLPVCGVVRVVWSY